MITFRVDGMTCAHCTRAVTEAIQHIDPDARVRIDMPSGRVDIEGASRGEAQLQAAIREAGYTAAVAD